MTGRFAKAWLIGMAVAAGPAARAQDVFQQPESHRGFVMRGFASDGTPPAESKGPKLRVVAAPPAPVAAMPAPVANVEKVKREADVTVVQPAIYAAPMAKAGILPWPKMPHGFQDPTHPVGPAEPGSAAKTRFGPYSSGLTLPRR